MTRDQVRRHLVGYAVLIVGAGVGGLFISTLVIPHIGDVHTPNVLYRDYQVWAYLALALLLVGVALTAWINRSRISGAPQRALVAFAATWFIAIDVAGNGHEVFGRSSSGAMLAPVVKAALAKLPPDTPFYSVDVLDHTMPFYIGHTMMLVQHADELKFGIVQEPQKWLPTVNAWVERWKADRYAMALMPPPLYAAMQARGLPMTVIARDQRRVIVEKPQPVNAQPAVPAFPASNIPVR
jgi:hypothetical protein